ncbi:hypothetical protein ACIA8C_17100 [Nocardia sp. NPDC051321]|uniref:hypothetical protein n=1 Tax=Nocardia sp. NPDC051321 TaxID=3364323 RepID=UPI003799447D
MIGGTWSRVLADDGVGFADLFAADRIAAGDRGGGAAHLTRQGSAPNCHLRVGQKSARYGRQSQ